MHAVDPGQRRARLAIRQRLASPSGTIDDAVAAMVGLHASDPVTVFLSARARVDGFVPAHLESALYERRSVVRMLGMRRTLFVVPSDFAAIMDEACTKRGAPAERRRLIGMIEAQGLAPDGGRWLRRVERLTMGALHERGEATATELVKAVPELGAKLTFGEGRKWAGQVGISTRVLFLLAGEGRVVRGRPRGSWVSSQYRWAPTDAWLGAPLETPDHRWASAELLRRWLHTFGPGTAADIRWWTGWTARQADAALAAVGAVEVGLDGTTGYVLPDDLDAIEEPGPWVALLPGLDPTVMGWKDRGWYLGDHAAALFDRNGNAGPTVWADGRVVGGWAQTAEGTIAVRLLERVDSATAARVRNEQERLRVWLGDVRVIPRFRSPVEVELTR